MLRGAGWVGLVAVFALLGGALAQTMLNHRSFALAQRQVAEARAALASVDDLSAAFKAVSRAVEPSVVSISTRSAVASPQLPLPRLFPFPFELPMPEGGEAIGTGSGIILEVDGDVGFVLTNNHVVANANSLEVTLYDGRVIRDVQVVGTDPRTDLAVVRIRADRLIAAKWGDSTTLEKGDWVIAFGSPFGYVGSMTVGVVSALNRQVGILGQMGYEDFIQTDAAINPGNSGGPLVNIRGEVVGINTAIASRTGAFNGIGFAVPSRLAKPVFDTLKREGRVARGFLGVSIADVSVDDPQLQQMVRATGFTGDKGVFVQQVGANAPAAGQLEPGDIILAMNGQPVANVRELRERVAAAAPGTEVTFEVFREGKTTSVKVKLGEQPDDNTVARGSAPGTPQRPVESAAGLTLANPTPEVLRQFNITANVSGAVVTGVQPNSLAARAGIRPGDVITRIDGRPVTSAAAASEALRRANLASGIRLNITNSEGSRLVMIRQP
ncbi:MAG: trypsin-like peptidase domain-containing protein [Tepidisphaerales bacterium]